MAQIHGFRSFRPSAHLLHASWRPPHLIFLFRPLAGPGQPWPALHGPDTYVYARPWPSLPGPPRALRGYSSSTGIISDRYLSR